MAGVCGGRGVVGVGGGGGTVDAREMHPAPAAPDLQAAARRGGGRWFPAAEVSPDCVSQRMRETFSGSRSIPQWQMSGAGDHDADGGVVLRGGFHGGGVPRPPMAARAGVDSDPLATSLFGGTEDLSASMDLPTTGNGYFSNMMIEDNFQGDFDNIQSQAMQVGLAVPTARPNHKRTKNFSEQEDEVLVSGWLNISLDAVVGKDQKGGRYWSRIYEYFNEHKPCQSQRTLNSLMHRWESIQKCVNKFCGCLTWIELRRQSGTTMKDMVAQACALYKSEDEHQKSFQFMHCWNKLRTQPKWLAKIDDLAAAKTSNKKQKTNPNGDPSARISSEVGEGEVGIGQEIALPRPMGKKKAKAAIIQEKKKSVTTTLENMWAEKKETDAEKELKKDERFNKAFALEQERVSNEKLLVEVRKEEVALQKQRDEERIMTMDISGMTDELKTYYMGLRAKIISRLTMPST